MSSYNIIVTNAAVTFFPESSRRLEPRFGAQTHTIHRAWGRGSIIVFFPELRQRLELKFGTEKI